MTKAKFGMINLETGEVSEDGIPVWIGKKVNVGERFFMAFQDAFIAIAKDREITAQPRRVLDYLMGKLDFENFIQVPQVEIVKELTMKKADVSKAIKILAAKKILLEGPKVGRSFSYRMNPKYGWKGKVSNLRKQEQSDERLRLAVDNTKGNDS